MTTLIGYARVSTADQDPQLQLDALELAGCARVYVDHGVSGSLASRPELDRMLDQLRAGDVVTVWRLDRLGRSVRNLITLVDDLAARGVGFCSLTEELDTTTAGGKFIFTVFGALAELERSITRERTLAGLESARARGRVGGRKPVMTGEKLAVARDMMASGQHTVTAVAATLGVSRRTLYRHLGAA
jgi:DNA invertase Pin-like site-specific DNA recombinase